MIGMPFLSRLSPIGGIARSALDSAAIAMPMSAWLVSSSSLQRYASEGSALAVSLADEVCAIAAKAAGICCAAAAAIASLRLRASLVGRSRTSPIIIRAASSCRTSWLTACVSCGRNMSLCCACRAASLSTAEM